MKYKAKINGIQVEATYSTQSIEELWKPLLRNLIKLQEEKNQRIIVFIAAPPATGKSTLVHFLEYLASEELHYPYVQGIGMDGFHRYNQDLKGLGLSNEKGSIRTFDINKLTQAIKSLTVQDTWFPFYDRQLHEPVENALWVNQKIILLEGNYLASTKEKWVQLRELSDYTIFIEADPSELKSRLIHRKMLSGWPLHEATHFYHHSDGKNVIEVLSDRCVTDMTIIMKNNEYDIKPND